MAFLGELRQYGDHVSVHTSGGQGLDVAALMRDPVPGTAVYCCGPERLLLAVEEQCAHWPADTLHVERFTAREVGAPVPTGSFEVVLADSGLTLTVPPDASMLEGAGLSVLTSCEEGTCGTCETAVLERRPEHRDSVLNARERAANDCMMVCVSRSCTPRLVLEL